MFLNLLISLSGFAFACRISDFVEQQRWLARELMTKIGTLYFIALVFASFVFSPRAPFVLWIVAFLPLFAFAIALIAVRRHRARVFRRVFRETLTLLLLRMKIGKSFRQAFSEAIDAAEPRWRPLLNEIRDLVVFSQQKDGGAVSLFTQQIVSEFRLADQTPHASIRRLENFRSRLRLEDDFRHKSGQVLRQSRAQSLVLSGLYLAVLFFVGTRFGWKANALLILVSSLLFSLGLVWIWYGGRRWKWKV